MEQIRGTSKDIVADNIEKLKGIFPEVFCEDKIDFERLQEVLGNYIDDKEERYRFEWNGKSKAIRMSQTPSIGTLRPCKKESKDWDTTKNLYIEGENLEVLKLLQKSYQNKVKIIYIDPPYNTGNDFIYEDNFRDNLWNYLAITGQLDNEGKKIGTNSDSSGRFHTEWLNMIYPRLRLARNLLSDDGVMFISIGSEEVDNLIKICNEIFGENNRLGVISRITKTASNNGTFFAPSVDYLICVARDSSKVARFSDKVDESLYKKVETTGERKGEKYRDDIAFYQSSQKDLRPNQKYFVEAPDGTKLIPPCSIQDEVMREGDGRWRWSKEKYLNEKELLVFKKTNTSPLMDEYGNKAKWNVYTKSYLKERQEKGTLPREIWQDFINRKGADLLKKMEIPFDFSKPVELIEYILQIINASDSEECIVLDFFSGSSTTAHAVMKSNLQDNKNRQFIMVQMPEVVDEKSTAYKEGYKNICEIGKERIRRAGDILVRENTLQNEKHILDVGFKVFKLDSSNIKKWNPDYDELEQSFDDILENFVPNRTEEDIVYEIMLKYGIDLTYPVEERVINGKKVFSIGFGALIICLDDKINLDVINGIVELKEELEPEICRVVFKDNGFANDSIKTNAIQILKSNNIKEVMSI